MKAPHLSGVIQSISQSYRNCNCKARLGSKSWLADDLWKEGKKEERTMDDPLYINVEIKCGYFVIVFTWFTPLFHIKLSNIGGSEHRCEILFAFTSLGLHYGRRAKLRICLLEHTNYWILIRTQYVQSKKWLIGELRRRTVEKPLSSAFMF